MSKIDKKNESARIVIWKLKTNLKMCISRECKFDLVN